MYKYLLSFSFLLLSFTYTFGQPCAGDISIIESENLEVWKVAHIDGASTIYSLAAFQGTVNVGGKDYTQPATDGGWGLIVMAHDNAGSFIWAQQISGPGFFVTSPTLIVSATDVVVSVTEGSEAAGQALRVESFGALDGTPGWKKRYPVAITGSNLSYAAQVMPYDGGTTSGGNFIIAGAFAGNLDLNIKTLTTTGSLSESFVFALDATGTELWAVQSSGSNGRGRAWTLAIGPSDEVVIGGHFTGKIDFEGTSFTATNNTVTNPYIAKLNSADGSPVWVQGMENGTANGFNNIYDIDIDGGGSIFFTGNFNDNINIQGNTITSAGGTDGMIGNLDTNGIYLWALQFGGASTSDEFGTTISVSPGTESVFVGAQLWADSVYYNNAYLNLPPAKGHYVFGIGINGAIDPISANSVSKENTFGYSAVYDTPTNTFIMASLSQNTGTNVNLAQWVPNRPRPYAYVTQENGILDPTEVLTAFDPGISYTYQWYKDGNPIPGETTATYTATTNGEYHVEVTNIDGCAVASEHKFILDGSSLESDSLVLVQLFNNTDGANWNDNTNWLSGTLDTWFGVTINGGRVTDLYLANNNLNGDFPSSIGNLTQLQQLYIDTNNLTGNIPADFWDITTLNWINLHDNPNLTWAIEAGVQNMTGLTGIRAFNTNLTGTIPAEIGGATALQEINLGSTALTGSIPPEIGNLTALTELTLEGNQLMGTIPTEITNLTNLITFNVRDNNLNGVLEDAVWQLPNIQIIQVDFNTNLKVTLPSNLASLTQLTILGITNTVPIGGPFPTAFYNLINLSVLDVGGHNFTGTLDPAIGNLTKLTGLWLFNNQLEGDFPDITNLTSLRAGSIAGNMFTSFPDISGLGVESFEISYNYLRFADIVPNMSIEGLSYAPQNRRLSLNTTVDEGGSLELVNDYTQSGNVYQWVLNQTDSVSTNANYTISGGQITDLGGYFCYVTNSAAPDLTILSKYYNIAFSGPPRSWSVDNSAGSVADFKSLYVATYGTNDGDTLYVAGSPTPYDMGLSVYESPRIIYGPGYFLSENPETQAQVETAKTSFIGFKKGAEGSAIYGMDIAQLFLNNNPSASNDTLESVHVTGNKIGELSFNDDCKNILVNKNYIRNLTLASTTAPGTSRSYQDLFINNNIIDTATTYFSKATAARNDMVNVVFDRNTIGIFTDSIQDATLTNNIINNYEATGNAESGTISFAGASFANASGMLNIDNDFVSTTNVDAGAFSGTEPYVLSGMAPIPHIFALNNTGRIRINAQAKNEVDANIKFLNYRLGEGGTLVQKGTVSRLEAGNPVDVLFRPRLGNVTPGATVDLMIWAKDVNGVKSVPQRLSFVAETTTATGNIFTGNNDPVTNGQVLLFEINQEGTGFDTLSTSLNNQGAFTFSNIVVGDYLALAKADLTDFPGHLPTYYEQIDLWEEADTLLIDASDPTFDITLLAEPKDPTGDGAVSGTIEEEFEEVGDGGRMMARGRVKKAGVSMRRRVRTGRPEGEKDLFELVDYVYSDDNGEFHFDNLPPDEYRINIQYPGYPMDTTSSIDITIGENVDNDYKLEALVNEGKISVAVISTTGIVNEIIDQVRVYPNPANNEGIYILFNSDFHLEGAADLKLFDIRGNYVTGKKVSPNEISNNQAIKLPLPTLKTGTYLLKVSQQNTAMGTIRLVIR